MTTPTAAAREPYAPTPFIESNALLAIQADDEETALACLDELLDNELRSVALAARRLADMAEKIRAQRARGTR